MRIAFVGPTYPLDSKPASVQQTVNMYPVPIEPGNERTDWVFKDMPGLVEAATFGSTTGEGLAELTGSTTAVDQTGADWAISVADALDLTTGHFLNGLISSESVVLSRDVPQTNPEVLDDFPTGGISTLQVDAWVYLDSAGAPSMFASVEVGVFSYPLETLFSLGVDADGFVLSVFSSPDEETFGESTETIPTDEWTHVRLLCVGQTVTIFINGVKDVTAGFTTTSLDPIGDAGPINLARLNFTANGVYLDEVRASIGGSESTANFTPPVAPWPNP